MKLLSYYSRGLHVGVLDERGIWDLRAACAAFLTEVERDARAAEHSRELVPSDMADFIRINHERLAFFERVLGHYVADPDREAWMRREGVLFDPAEVKLLPPVLRPSKILAVGNSFVEHIENTAKSTGLSRTVPPEVKISFLKAPSSILGDGEALVYPKNASGWDYEAELAIVVGRECYEVERDEAAGCIFGYTVMNDASVRDVPESLGGYTSPLGKSRNTMAPLGPVIVTSTDANFDVGKVAIQSWVNGELRQDGNSSDLLWPVDEILFRSAAIMRLLPGDIISTGSPAGVALESGKYLSEGDLVRVAVEGIGSLENRVQVGR